MIVRCLAERCRLMGQHAPGCGSDACRGCLRRRAADGLGLCLAHVRWLAEDARAAAQLYRDLELVLTSVGRSDQERVSGARGAGLALNQAAVDSRDTIRAVLASWALLVAEERGLALPPDDVTAIGEYLARHAQWLAAHPAAADASGELFDLAHGRARSVAFPSGVRTIPLRLPGKIVPCRKMIGLTCGHAECRLVRCPERGCPGTILATVRDTDSMLPSTVTCDADLTHLWTPSQWHALARKLTQRAPSPQLLVRING